MQIAKKTRIPPSRGGELRALVEEVADQVGVAAPDDLIVDLGLNTSLGRWGWRQRTVLTIGAPMWAIPRRQLAHVGVPPDPRRSLASRRTLLGTRGPDQLLTQSRSVVSCEVLARGGRRATGWFPRLFRPR